MSVSVSDQCPDVIRRFILCIAVSAAALLFAAVSASAQDGLPYDIVAGIWDENVEWGDSVASGGDVNLDGLDDILVFDPSYENELNEQVGQWYMYSGKDGTLLWTYEGTAILDGRDAGDTMSAAFVGDLDGDEASEIVAGTAMANDDDGCVIVLSGLTGTPIEIWHPEVQQAQMGIDVTAAGDVNADSIPDFAYIERRYDDGLVTVRSGADLSIIKQINVRHPRRIRWAGDMNNDNHDDLAIASWCRSGCNHPYLTKVYSGQLDNEVLLKLYPPKDDQDMFFGYGLAAGSDVTGDGVPDFVVLGRLGYYAYLYSGQSGKPVTRFSDENEDARDYFGIEIEFADFNGDGTDEIAIWSDDALRIFNPDGQRVYYMQMYYRSRDMHGWITGNEQAIGRYNDDTCMDFIGDIGYSWYFEPAGYGMTVNAGSPLLLSTECPTGLGCGKPILFDVYGDHPGRTIYLLSSRHGCECTFSDQLGICIDLTAPLRVRGQSVTGADRMTHFEVDNDKNYYGTIWVQAIDPNHPKHGSIKSNVWRLR